MPRPSHLSPDNILRFLQVRTAPASTAEIAQGLHLKKSDNRPLFKMLSKLKKRRAIEELPGGRYRLPTRKSERDAPGQKSLQDAQRRPQSLASHDEVKGRLVLHHDGYGFVVPDSPIPQLDGDVFIPRDAIQDAMHGDHVLAKIQHLGGITGAQRAEGRILRVLDRAHPTVVGLFRYGSQQNVVLPYDTRIQHEIEIPRGNELTPGLWKKLGFSGADETSIRSRRIPRLGELDGAVVNVELLRYPHGGASPTGRVIEILGRPGDLGVDTEIIIRKHHLPHVFAAEVLDEAERGAKPVGESERAGHEDFRHLPIVTIDGETARDFDDAVYVEHRADSGWHLQVHIADVGHYVRTATPLDQEARLRGTSVYFPDRAVPMLPEALSNGMCSLKPREDRLVMSVLMEFDAAGNQKSSRMTPGVIRSAERMTYTDVNKVCEGDAERTERYAKLAHHFRAMKELALLLNARRNEHGFIDFDLPEPVIEFDDRLGQIEVDGAVFIPARVQKQRQFLHGAEMMRELRVAFGPFSVAFTDLVHVRVRHALGGTDNAGSHPRRFLVARRVELHEHAHDQTVLARLQRTHAIRKRFGQHGHGAVGEINRGAAQARFPVENRAGANIMRDVRDVHLKMPAVCSAFDVDGVIEIARGFPVNRYNRQMAKIFAVRAFGLADGFGAKLRFLHDFVREQMRQVMLAYDDFGIYTEFARSTENFDDTAARRGAAAGKTRQLDVDHRAVEFRHARNAAAAEAALIEAARTHFLRKVRRQFVPRRNDDFVLDAGVVGENHVSLRAVTKQTHDRGVRAVQDANDAALGTLGAWDTAPPLDLHQNVVSVHDVFDGIAG